jgi:ribosomal protein S18 acetylase RimI-like enzyme
MLEIKEIEEKDIEFMYKILNEENIIKSLHIKPMSYNDVIEAYNKYWTNDPDEKNFIISLENTSVGWIKLIGLCNDEKAFISGLVISSNYQHKGIGTKGILFSEKYLKEKGLKKIGINTTDDNIKAKSLYMKCGYEIIEKRNKIMEDGNEILYVMLEKEIE